MTLVLCDFEASVARLQTGRREEKCQLKSVVRVCLYFEGDEPMGEVKGSYLEFSFTFVMDERRRVQWQVLAAVFFLLLSLS